jgi:hypothetical protein
MNKNSIPLKKGNCYRHKAKNVPIPTYADFAVTRKVASEFVNIKSGTPFMVLDTDSDLAPEYLQIKILIEGSQRVIEIYIHNDTSELANYFEAYIDQ